jgi:uncharacterized phage protein (TIGR01671 family)
MREIKFRGKRLDNGEWIYGYYGHKEATDQHYIMIERLHDAPEYGSYFVDVEVDPKTVGQYTGLKDRSGKEIYEGDILRFVIFNYDGSDEGIKTGFVSWEEQAAAYVIRESLESMDAYWMYVVLGNDDEVEVIGNINDHPHLLKGVSE